MQNLQKKKLMSQCIVNEKLDSFIIAKKFNNFTSIISPFVFNDQNNEYDSNFIIQHSRAYRVQSLYNLIPKLSKYSVLQDYIYFDCLHKLPLDVFDNYNSGLIHFYMQNNSVNTKDENGEEKEIINIDVKMLLNEIQDEDIVFENTIPIKFSTTSIKVFPIILYKGFILSIANQTSCVMYLTLTNPKEGLVGNCNRKEIINITQNIFPIWPFFNISADDSSNKIFLKDNIMQHIEEKLNHDIVYLKMEYDFSDPSNIFIQQIGNI